MFNIRRKKIAVEFTQPIKPNQIPGSSIEEKAAYISEMLSNKLADDFIAGRITEEQIYKLVADKNIQAEEDFQFLEQYRLNIAELRKLAGKLLKSEGISQPNEIAIDSIIQKLLERAGTYFVPQLIKLHRVDSRSEELITPLLSYKKPEEITAIQNFIRVEVLKRRLAVKDEFIIVLQRGKLFNPAFTEEQLIFILENEFNDIAQNDSIVLTPVQSKEIKDELITLDKKVLMMNSKARLWNRILEIHPDIPNKDEWSALIPDELRITWTLKAILRYFDFDVSGKDESRRRIKETTDSPKIRAEQSDSLYYYFFPDTDEYEKPILNPRPYALGKLRECIENGFDNERLFSILGLSTKRRSKSKEKLKTENAEENENVEIVEDPASISVADAQDKYAKRISYWYKYQTKIVKQIPGETLEQKASYVESLTTEQIAENFKSGLITEQEVLAIAGSDRASRFIGFRDDLREAGIPDVAKMLGQVFEMPEDQRYADFNLKFLSNEEKKLCDVLRNEYNLDPIPFPVKIPCPSDNPTTVDRFEIDFLLPCDVLVGFSEEETVTNVNEVTGEVESQLIVKPIIEHRVIFVGEYFGIKYTDEKTVEDKGRPWVTPSGELPVFIYNKGEDNENIHIIEAGKKSRTLELYKLKTQWKIFTTNVIADMLGTRTLSLDDTELRYKRPLMRKLDEARIIYNSPNCTANSGCAMLKLIKENATVTPELRKYTEPNYIRERFDDDKHRSLNVIECAITNVKLSEALMIAKRQFVSEDVSAPPGHFNQGFNRETMYAHTKEFESVRKRIDMLQRSLYIKPIRTETTEQQQVRRRKVVEQIEVLENLILGFDSSPLYDFKLFLDQILKEGEVAEKITKLEELKRQIENDEKTFTLGELRQEIFKISKELLAQTMERGMKGE